ALHQFIADRINDRIKSALTGENSPSGGDSAEVSEVGDSAGKIAETPENGIVTTEEELEGYYIVKSILRDIIDPKRIVYRDTLNYFGILVDDNNRKPICRLHFNRSQKYIGLFDAQKNEERIAIDGLNDIYKFADRLRTTTMIYLSPDMKIITPPAESTIPAIGAEG
ncbi:MAG: hypothetical protein ABI876_12655, partial [Bacteroidota bacterium]